MQSENLSMTKYISKTSLSNTLELKLYGKTVNSLEVSFLLASIVGLLFSKLAVFTNTCI